MDELYKNNQKILCSDHVRSQKRELVFLMSANNLHTFSVWSWFCSVNGDSWWNRARPLPAGGYGIDFSQACEDVCSGVSFVAKKILEHGVTSFCPTLVTSPPAVYHKVPPTPQLHDVQLCWQNYWPVSKGFSCLFCRTEQHHIHIVCFRFCLRSKFTMEDLMELEFLVRCRCCTEAPQ